MDAYVIQAVAIATALAGLLAPFLIALINRPTWSSLRKQNVALGVSVLLGVVGLFLAGAFTEPITEPAAWGVALLAVIGASQTIYTLLLKTTGVGDRLEALGSGDTVVVHENR